MSQHTMRRISVVATTIGVALLIASAAVLLYVHFIK